MIPRSTSFVLGCLMTAIVGGAGDARPSSEQARTLYEVYARLTAAAGISSPPRLEICQESQGTCEIARFEPDDLVIRTSERLYALCGEVTYGRQGCLAAVLAHELGHFEKWRQGGPAFQGDFGSASSALGRLTDQEAEERMHQEGDADLYGGWLGHLAGYGTLDAMPATLDVIYKYVTPDSRLYPTIEQRKKIVANARDRLYPLIAIFRAANALLLVGSEDAAAFCYDHIGRTFPSREIFNNAGLARAVAAFVAKRDPRPPYPWILDASSRLEGPDKTRGSTRGPSHMTTEAMLQQAEEKLLRARELDRAYLPAMLNLVGVYDLLGKPGTARELADQALTLARMPENQPMLPAAWLFHGIATRQGTGGVLRARADFRRAEEQGDSLAPQFLGWIKGEMKPHASPACKALEDGDEEMIDQQPIEDFAGGDSWLRIPTEGRDWPWLKITYRQEENKWYGVTVNGSNDLPLATIIGTLDEYSGETSRHIKRHSALAEVLRKYGCPSLRQHTRTGEVLIYGKLRLIFLVGTDGVESWMLYKT